MASKDDSALDRPQPPAGVRPSAETVTAWQARKFGMFIHFGLYSTLGGVWQGKEIHNGYSEQIMSHAPIPLDEYAALAKQFDPVKFDADAIVGLAKDAGMRYIVITSKHHDGFNMFRTRLTDYNIVDATPYGKDVVKQLADACARGGLKFGVYYSSIDWHYLGATPWTDDNNNPIPKTHEDFNVGQLKELTSNYGPLTEIWFDMGKPTPAQSTRFAGTVHAAQPQCMVSGRVFNNQGDFTVMGDNEVPDFAIDEPWQTPASIYTDTWGYRSWAKRDDLQGKINEHVTTMVQVVSRGGNYLLNIGPKGDGSLVDFEVQVLRGVGAWLRVNGEAIYGAQAQPFRKLDFGYATVKADKLYLFVREWPHDGLLRLPGLQNKIRHAYLLADTARRPLAVGAQTIHVEHPQAGATLTTVAAEYDGPLTVVPPSTAIETDGGYTLRASDADHFLNYNGEGYSAPATIYKEQWAVTLKESGAYRVELSYEPPGAERKVDIVVQGHRLSATLGGASRETAVGTVDLDATRWFPLKITPPEPFTKGVPLGVKITGVQLRRVM